MSEERGLQPIEQGGSLPITPELGPTRENAPTVTDEVLMLDSNCFIKAAHPSPEIEYAIKQAFIPTLASEIQELHIGQQGLEFLHTINEALGYVDITEKGLTPKRIIDATEKGDTELLPPYVKLVDTLGGTQELEFSLKIKVDTSHEIVLAAGVYAAFNPELGGYVVSHRFLPTLDSPGRRNVYLSENSPVRLQNYLRQALQAENSTAHADAMVRLMMFTLGDIHLPEKDFSVQIDQLRERYPHATVTAEPTFVSEKRHRLPFSPRDTFVSGLHLTLGAKIKTDPNFAIESGLKYDEIAQIWRDFTGQEPPAY